MYRAREDWSEAAWSGVIVEWGFMLEWAAFVFLHELQNEGFLLTSRVGLQQSRFEEVISRRTFARFAESPGA